MRTDMEIQTAIEIIASSAVLYGLFHLKEIIEIAKRLCAKIKNKVKEMSKDD